MDALLVFFIKFPHWESLPFFGKSFFLYYSTKKGGGIHLPIFLKDL